MIKRAVTAVVTICGGIALGVMLAVAGHSDTAIAATPEISISVPPASGSPSSTPETIAGESTLTEGSGYFIKEYKGRVSVIRGGSDVPEMIFDISTKMLPEVDRKQLSEGIYVETYEELMRLVEDYIS